MLKVTKEEAIASMKRFIAEFGRYPTRFECAEIEWLFPPSVFRALVGKFKDITLLEEWYEENPNLCKHCNKKIEFCKRKVNDFCDQSCAASYNNARRHGLRAYKRITLGVVRFEPAKTACGNCGNCGTPLHTHQKFYCSLLCTSRAKQKEKLTLWLEVGKASGNRAIRGFLAELHGYQCSSCGISEWNGKPITLEVEHISGDSEDSSKENVCLICPNCHSQTATYKGKNRGHGRHKRAQRYRDGKSY